MDENSKVVPLWDPPWYNICDFNVNRGKVRYVSKPDMPGFISNKPFVGCIDDALSDVSNFILHLMIYRSTLITCLQQYICVEITEYSEQCKSSTGQLWMFYPTTNHQQS